MSEQMQQQQQNQNPLQRTESIPFDTKPKTEVEFQKHVTDAEFLNVSFYTMFCGWRLITKEEDATLLNVKYKVSNHYFEILEGARLCNEAGANFLFSTAYPLINHLVTTGTLDKMKIYYSWIGSMDALTLELEDSVTFDSNPYEIKNIYKIPTIIQHLCKLHLITYKALEGFTMHEIAETIITSTAYRFGDQQPQVNAHQEGFLEKFFGIGKKG